MSSQLVEFTDVREIPLSRLKIAPWNARKTFSDLSIAELASSMSQSGIINPLIVRPLDDQHKEFEIVAGHRRRAAAVAALLPSAPCIVRDLSDEEARELGMVDNLQRENVPPLEEARGFADLLRSRAGSTVESIAATLGKDASYVGRRLKLLNAIEPVQNALEAGAIEVGHALELCRLSEKQQMALLDWLNVGYNAPQIVDVGEPSDFDDDEDEDVCSNCGEIECECGDQDTNDTQTENEPTEPAEPQWFATPKTVALLRAQIAKSELIVLSSAPFPLEDELPPMACVECPKRTSANSLLFSDITTDTCTDRDCYDGKVRAWIRYSIQHAEEQGAKLIPLSDRYTTEYESAVNRHSVIVLGGDVEMCDKRLAAIWVTGERAGHGVYICTDRSCAVHYDQQRGGAKRSGDPAQDKDALKRAEKEKADRRKVLDKVKIQKRYREALLDALGKEPLPDATPEIIHSMLEDVTVFAIQRMTSIYNKRLAASLGWDESLLDYGAKAKLRKHLISLNYPQLLRASLLAIHMNDIAVHEYNVGSKDYRPQGFEEVAQYLGVDHKALRTAAEESVKPKEKAKPEPKAETKPTAVGKKAAAGDDTPDSEAPKPLQPAGKKAAKKALQQKGKK